jgi:signal transduction histidine kinase
VLAFLQYRWIGQVSESERERLEEGLDIASRRFVEDIYLEVSSVASGFQVQPATEVVSLEAQLSGSIEHWLTTAADADIVRSVYVSERDSAGELKLSRFDPEFGSLDTVGWPQAMEGLKLRLDRITDLQRPGSSRTPFDSDLNAFRQPVSLSGDRDSVWILVPMVTASDISVGNIQRPLADWTLVEIDTDVFASRLLPALVTSHFDARDYKVAVFESDRSDRALFRSEETLSRTGMTSPDLAVTALASDRLGPGGMAAPTPQRGRGRRIASQGFTNFDQPFGRGGPDRGLGSGLVPFTLFGASWQLVAQHQSGSLETAVSTLRRRNLFVGRGILALLGLSGVMTIVWAERVRSIGRLQMEFAAGISHELRTPLTTIRTAAHNIASGIVSKPEEVREYAAMVKAEGKRLSQMVDQTIQFAQTESGRRHYELRPVDVSQVIDQTLGVTFSSSDEAQSKVWIDMDPNLPLVLADEMALTHSLGNLVVNALKYGIEDGRVLIEARPDTRTNRVQLSVSNSGAAIDPSDIQHIFEPFYRGRNIDRTPGSGLGLSLVLKMIEGQNGEVTVSSQPGMTRFTLHLPAVLPIEHAVSLGAQP